MSSFTPWLKRAFLCLPIWSFAVTTGASIYPGLDPIEQVYQFPSKGTWLENLVMRPSGNILATRLDRPELYQFKLSPKRLSKPELVYTFPNAMSMTGIVEIEGKPDIYAVLVGNFSFESIEGIVGSWSIWEVDFQHREKPSITKLANIPNAALPNGMVSLDADQEALLIADSSLDNGGIWRFDLRTRLYTMTINDPMMKKANSSVPEGINGLKRVGSSLLYTNSYAPFLANVPIHANGTAAGNSKIVAYSARSDWTFDDLAVDASGTAYVATGTGNSITRIRPSGDTFVIAGNPNSTEIAEPTAVIISRRMNGEQTLYVTTGGAQGDPINGTVVVGAQLVEIELS